MKKNIQRLTALMLSIMAMMLSLVTPATTAANLRKAANLEKEVVLIGTGPRIEIWNRDSWEATFEEENADEIAERMGEWGFDI